MVRITHLIAFLAAYEIATAKDILVAGLAEFNEASAVVAPGDVIVFKNGSYSSLKLVFKAQGTEMLPITLRAESAGDVVFTGNSQIFLDGNWLVVSGFKYDGIAGVPITTTPYDVEVGAVVTFLKTTSNSRLTETAIVNSGSAVTSYFHMEPGGQYNRVDHCYFSGQRGIGPSLYIEAHKDIPGYARMEACYVGNRPQGSGNRWETLRIGHSDQQYFQARATVIGNLFYKCDGENEMISNKSSGNKYLYNHLLDNRGELTLRHGDETWIEGNLLQDAGNVGASGIRVIGSRHIIISNYLKRTSFGFNVYAGETNPEPKGYTQVIDAVIAFNTLENCGNGFLLGTSGRPAAPRNLRIAYNLVQAGGAIIQYDNGGTDARYEGNIMYGGSLGTSARTGISTEKPALVEDEWGRLVSDLGRLPFQVNPASVPQAAKDLNGAVRGATPNVGAIQVSNAKPLYPLAPKEVGPLWMGRIAASVSTGSAPRERALLTVAPGFFPHTVEILLPYFNGKAATLDIHDFRGRPVRRLSARSDRLSWDGRDHAGTAVPVGSYLLSATLDGMRAGRTVIFR